MLVSAYFEKMLTPRWLEGQELDANGSIELNIIDTEPNTFLIILNIIHYRMARFLALWVLMLDRACYLGRLFPMPRSFWTLSIDMASTLEKQYSFYVLLWSCEVDCCFLGVNYDDIFTNMTDRTTSSGLWYLYDLLIPESIYYEWYSDMFKPLISLVWAQSTIPEEPPCSQLSPPSNSVESIWRIMINQHAVLIVTHYI